MKNIIEVDKSKKTYHVFYIMKKMISKYLKYCPIPFFLYIILDILHGLSFGIITILQQNFFDKATELANGQRTILSIIVSLLILCSGYVISQLLNGISNYVPLVLSEKVKGYLSSELHEKLSKIPAIQFEDIEKLDYINKAEEGKNNILQFFNQFIEIFIFYLPYYILMGWYLFNLKPILVLLILCVFIPTFGTQFIRIKIFTDVEDKSASARRKLDYYKDCMVSRDYYKETRLLGGFTYFKKMYLNVLETLQKLRFEATFRSGLIDLAANIVTVLGYIGILLLLFSSLIHGEISTGAFAAILGSLTTLYGMMEELFCENMVIMSQNFGTIQNYLKFIELEEIDGEDIYIESKHDIILDHVSFSYPGTDEYAIKDLSLQIKEGETLAIVGENGSGKSTLIRLLTGLYQPQMGKVTFSGIDVSKVKQSNIFMNISAVFQKFQRYQMTLRENIRISQVNKEEIDGELDQISKNAGVIQDTNTYPEAYNTMLSREFGGIDISGGQWQRIAIARALYRTHEIIILDEPTSAIDPIEETRIYNQFAKMAKDKIAIIVTHRLGSVKLADRIVVLKHGKIAEFGTHDELIKKDGEYSMLYKSQEQWYQQN